MVKIILSHHREGYEKDINNQTRDISERVKENIAEAINLKRAQNNPLSQ